MRSTPPWSRFVGSHLVALGALLAGACSETQSDPTLPDPDQLLMRYQGPCKLSATDPPAQVLEALRGCGAVSEDLVDTRLRRNLDVLFLIDSSPSMSPKQKALAQNIPRFMQAIDATNANYHVGVATADVGTYVAPGQPWATSIGSCNTYEGDDGLLQRVACTTRVGVTGEALNACMSLCTDPSFVPQDGKGYISRDNGVTNVPKLIVNGVDVGPQRTFQCIASVGDSGCGVEQIFEGAKRALDGHNPANDGFLRPDSVLAVLFITDEDDCTAKLGERRGYDPAAVPQDCPAPSKDAPFSCFNPDYRCLAMNVVCDQPLNSAGAKTNCHERPDSFLEPVEKYAAFFSSLRPASRLLVGGIWALPRLDQGGKFVVTQRLGAMSTQGLNRDQSGMESACINARDPALFGQPQLRMSRLAEKFPGSLEVSVCDVDNYPKALDSISSAIKNKLEVTCLSAPPYRTDEGRAACLVGEVDEKTPGALPARPMPECGAGCCQAWAASARPTPDDPTIAAACAGEAADACFCVPTSSRGVCPLAAVAGVVRKAPSPPDKLVSFRCVKEYRCGL